MYSDAEVCRIGGAEGMCHFQQQLLNLVIFVRIVVAFSAFNFSFFFQSHHLAPFSTSSEPIPGQHRRFLDNFLIIPSIGLDSMPLRVTKAVRSRSAASKRKSHGPAPAHRRLGGRIAE